MGAFSDSLKGKVDELNVKVGEYIKLKRKKKGVTQITVENEIPIPRTTLSQYERGKKSITIENLYKISKYLDFNMAGCIAYVIQEDMVKYLKTLMKYSNYHSSTSKKHFMSLLTKTEQNHYRNMPEYTYYKEQAKEHEKFFTVEFQKDKYDSYRNILYFGCCICNEVSLDEAGVYSKFILEQFVKSLPESEERNRMQAWIDCFKFLYQL